MSEWSAGYVSDIGYTFGYYAELNPLRACAKAACAGLKSVPCQGAEANVAELTAMAQGFADKQLPILKALQVA